MTNVNVLSTGETTPYTQEWKAKNTLENIIVNNYNIKLKKRQADKKKITRHKTFGLVEISHCVLRECAKTLDRPLKIY